MPRRDAMVNDPLDRRVTDRKDDTMDTRTDSTTTGRAARATDRRTAHASDAATRALVWAGVLAGPIFVAVALVQVLTREGFDLSWLGTVISGLLVSVLAVIATSYFQGSRATLTAFRDHRVDDLHTLWKRWSVWIQPAIVPLAAAWVAAPQEWRDAVPKWALVAMMVSYAVATIGAQAIKQPGIKDGG